MSPPPPPIPPNNTLKLKARLISIQRQTRCSQWAVIGLCLYIFLLHIISATHLYLACVLLASSKLTFLHFLHTMRIEDVTKSFLTITGEGRGSVSIAPPIYGQTDPSMKYEAARKGGNYLQYCVIFISSSEAYQHEGGACAVSAPCEPRASLCHPELVLCRVSPRPPISNPYPRPYVHAATEGFLVSVARIFQSNFPTLAPSYTQLGLATWIIGPPPLSSPLGSYVQYQAPRLLE